MVVLLLLLLLAGGYVCLEVCVLGYFDAGGSHAATGVFWWVVVFGVGVIIIRRQ